MDKRCGAKTRDGDPCKNAAMPNGRCRMHGGKSTGRPLITGRYSLKHRQALQEKVSQFLEDERPGDLMAELALMRGLLQDYLERFQEAIPLKYENTQHVFDMVESISRTVERISRMLNQTALTVADLQYVERRIPDLLIKYIDDPNKRLEFLAEFQRDFGSVRERADRLALLGPIAISTPKPLNSTNLITKPKENGLTILSVVIS